MPDASSFNVPFEALADRCMWLRRVVAKLPIANYPARFINTARAFQNSSTGVRLLSIGSRLAARSDGLGRAFNYTSGDPDMNIWTEELNGPGMSDISPCASDGTYVFTFDISAGTCRYTGDLGSTWNTLSGGANNVTAAAYVRGLWTAATSDDEILYTVGPASPWTAGPNLGGSVTARSRVAALGRHWACIRSGALTVFDTVSGTNVPFRLGGNDGSVGLTELHRHGDRVVAAYIDGAGDLTYSFSLRAVT